MKNLFPFFIAFLFVAFTAQAQQRGCFCPNGTQLGDSQITNGDFSGGNTGFSSDLPFETSSCTIGAYAVEAQARDKCINWPTGIWDNTSGNASGSFLVIDGGSSEATYSPNRVWHTTVNLVQGNQYEFIFHWLPKFGASASTNTKIAGFIDGVNITGVLGPVNSTAWQDYCYPYIALRSGTVEISIRQMENFSSGGYDYGLDDISFKECETIVPPCDVTAKWKDVINEQTCEVSFINYSSAGTGTTIVGYSWDFGDGSTSSDFAPTHFYNAPGTYYACLTVYGLTEEGECCTDTFCDKVEVHCESGPCKIKINTISLGIPPNGSCNYQLYASVTANRPIIGYSWSFGDGTTGTGGPSVLHNYPGSGTYYACVTVVAQDGEKCCTATFCKKVEINCHGGHEGAPQGFIHQTEEGNIAVQHKSDLHISPNPATDVFNISFDAKAASEYQLTVINLQGTVVLQRSGNSEAGQSKMQLDASRLSAGAYFVNVMIEGKLLSEKLIIQ